MKILRTYSDAGDEIAAVSPGIVIAGSGYLGHKLVEKSDKKKIKEAHKKFMEKGKEIKELEDIKRKTGKLSDELSRKLDIAKGQRKSWGKLTRDAINKSGKHKNISKKVALGTAALGGTISLLGHAANKENK